MVQLYYYTYYSYEEYGRGYIGHRGCECLPEQDIKYFGSFKDKTFKPTQKIILKDDYPTREEAISDEIILQRYYKVVDNPHFVNKAYQTSTKFCTTVEQSREAGKIGGKISGKKALELGLGIHAQTPEQRSEYGKKGGKISGKKTFELGRGIHGRTKEQMTEDGKKGGKITGKINGKKHAREFTIVSPTGEVIRGRNIREFARENNLARTGIQKVLNGKYKHHKGYTRYNDN